MQEGRGNLAALRISLILASLPLRSLISCETAPRSVLGVAISLFYAEAISMVDAMISSRASKFLYIQLVK